MFVYVCWLEICVKKKRKVDVMISVGLYRWLVICLDTVYSLNIQVC